MKKQLLLLVMMLLPMVAMADESGTCGDNLTWYYDSSTQTLTIFGTGPMYNYEYDASNRNHPWYRIHSYVSSIIIEEGVTTIGDNAFGRFWARTVSIPSSLTSIGKSAFLLSYIQSATLPNSVVTIGEAAFQQCSNLTSINIPDGITSIESATFLSCGKLSSITIPSNVTSIGHHAFSGCSGLSSISIPNGITTIEYNAFSGCGFTSLTIPNSVTAIQEDAFSGCSSLTNVIMGDNIASIGNDAFSNCKKLTTINLPSGLVSIGENAFQKCSALTSVTFPSSLTSIGDFAYNGCSSLTDVRTLIETPFTISDNVFSLYNIPLRVTDGAIEKYQGTEGWNNFDDIIGMNDLMKGNAFTVDGIKYCVISGSSKEVQVGTGDGTSAVETSREGTVNVPSSVIGSDGNTYTITKIGNYAFNNCKSITNINIPSGVTSIGSRAFQGCKLKTLSLPNSIINIGYFAFQGCIELTEVNIPLGVTKMDGQIFMGCRSLKQIEIPAGVTVIGDNEFGECRNLTKLIIADSESELIFVRGYGRVEKWGVTDCPLEYVYVGRNIKARYDYDYTTYVHYSPFYAKETITNLIIGDKVTEISKEAFSCCAGITSVVLPEGIKSVGYAAFSECEKLSSINLPDGITTLGERAFEGCISLQSITLPSNITSIGVYTFSNCNKLRSISIPGKVREIEYSAFSGCNFSKIRFEDGEWPLSFRQTEGWDPFPQMTIEEMYVGRDMVGHGSSVPFNLTISKTVTSLEAFYGCKIKTLTFEEGSDTLDSSYNSIISSPPFKNATIDSIYLGRVIVGKETRYNSSVKTFAYTSSSFSMRIGNNITEIGDDTYSGWKIDSLYIPKNVKKIGSSPFNNCAYLHDIFIEDGDETLEFGEGIGFYGIQLRNLYLGRNIAYPENKSPFSRNKEALTNLTIGNHVTDIGDGQFTGCKNLNQLNFPESLKRIGKQAFYGCSGLTTLDIPNNIVEVGKDAFNLCTGLTSVVIEDCEEPLTIDNNFMNGELKKVYLGRNINYPEGFAPFSGLDYLDSLIIGSKVTAIGKSAFAACSKLKDVVSYAEIVPTTNEYAFTQSYLPNATLLVPHKLYDQYSVTRPWSLFGNIKNFEGLYNLIYIVDGEEYKKSVVEQGTSITAEAEPTKEGYSFSGWSDIPKTMPDHDLKITGSFSINSYKLTYMIDDQVYKEVTYEYGTTITPEPQPEGDFQTFEWTDLPQTMPAHDVVVHASYTSGIIEVLIASQKNVHIYSPNGKKLNKLQKGLNIVILDNGTVKKVIMK